MTSRTEGVTPPRGEKVIPRTEAVTFRSEGVTPRTERVISRTEGMTPQD